MGIWIEVTTVNAEDLEQAGNTLKYIDGSVKDNNGKGYIYSVKAKNGNVTSDYDKKGLAFYRLTPPGFVSGVSNVKGEVTLTWKKVDAHGYEVQYSLDGGKTWIKVPQTTDTTTTIKGLESGKTYVFRIRCQKTNKDRGTTWSYYSKWLKVNVK